MHSPQPCKISNRAEKRRIKPFRFSALVFSKCWQKQKRSAKRSASYCSRWGTPSECLSQVGGISAGRSDLRLLSGDASSVCNFNIGFAARLVFVCYLLCSAEFAIRQRHYSASLQLAFIALRQKVMCDFFFSGGNSCVPLVASDHRSSAENRQNIKFQMSFILHTHNHGCQTTEKYCQTAMTAYQRAMPSCFAPFLI